MSDIQNPILVLIDKAVEEKTFSLDALTAVSKIKDQAINLANELKQVRDSLDEQKRETNRQSAARSVAETSLEGWKSREAAIVAREKKLTELEKTTAVAQAQSGVYSTLIDKMFANRQFRETVMDNATKPVVVPGSSYPNMMTETRNVSVERSDVK